MSKREITAIASPNIALVKYWGKRDDSLILPLNSSLSITLSQKNIFTKTIIKTDMDLKSDRFILNGKETKIQKSSRLHSLLTSFREKFLSGKTRYYEIISENNFPTAAGLASSASGYACIAYSLYKLEQDDIEKSNLFEKNDRKNLEIFSQIARIGSGSACRSLFGGFVAWDRGEKLDGTDSISRQVFPSAHWPDLRVMIVVVNSDPKKVPSTDGMKNSVLTSKLLNFRAESIVPKHMEKITKAIEAKNFAKFAKIVIRESNQLHSICLDSSPPLFYLNENSRAIISVMEDLNKSTSPIVAYTFDAGPNAVLIFQKENKQKICSTLFSNFSFSFPEDVLDDFSTFTNKPKYLSNLFMNVMKKEKELNFIKYIFFTKIGNGPEIIINKN
ncbi:diphosphomevalonate decarboxylase [Anaeramoeba ignava]|uniref:Diphosphomevalonate decarboxylase n=1 Tax=Anaeramoeba ignava TaxID=1746090 RepID=A0A9Q0REJ4_ANAIG|nr:diphosphomevalonate decarboxylase [Anaeramoeba ignava]